MEVYPASHYPSFCSGGAYILSMDVVHLLDSVSDILPPYKLEDVHITGFMRTMIDVPIRHGNSSYLIYGEKLEDEFLGPDWQKYLFSHNHDVEKKRLVWDKLKEKALA